jgi:crossover junction endodeoxyribonuclease RuvC
MRVLSIDPGYDRCGVAILEYQNGKEALIFSTCITTDKKSAKAERLLMIGKELEAIIATHQPTALGIETLFFNKNITTGIGVAEARGVVLYLAEKHGLTIYEHGPQEVKVAVTGYGASDKNAVYAMVSRLIPNIPKSALDDEYDAIAVGITTLAQHGRNR